MAKATRKIRNASNTVPDKGTVFTQPSETVPNQSMSVLEMVKRHRQGLPLSGGQVPIFNGDDPLPDISNMDLADAQRITEAIADQLVEARARIEQYRKDKAKEAAVADFEEKLQARIKELREKGELPDPGKDAKAS